MNGATTKELMATMGHSSPAAALRYQHSTQARQNELAQRMAAAMEQAASAAGPRAIEGLTERQAG